MCALLKQMSYTAESCAISWVDTASFSMSQIVHVVSIDEVPMMAGLYWFQSKLVIGAQYSEFV